MSIIRPVPPQDRLMPSCYPSGLSTDKVPLQAAVVVARGIIMTLVRWLSFAALLSSPALALCMEAPAPDTSSVEKVMASFHAAVAAHDGPGLERLFIEPGSTWVTVLSDQAFAAVKAHHPEAPKAKPGSYRDFAHFVATTKSSLDPRHTNVHIQSDGAVASAWFDFQFFIDGKVQNQGSETWQLVKTEAGWRIVAIAYSSNPPAS
jgi:ketosteroid isomerase-like protein